MEEHAKNEFGQSIDTLIASLVQDKLALNQLRGISLFFDIARMMLVDNEIDRISLLLPKSIAQLTRGRHIRRVVTAARLIP